MSLKFPIYNSLKIGGETESFFNNYMNNVNYYTFSMRKTSHQIMR